MAEGRGSFKIILDYGLWIMDYGLWMNEREFNTGELQMVRGQEACEETACRAGG